MLGPSSDFGPGPNVEPRLRIDETPAEELIRLTQTLTAAIY